MWETFLITSKVSKRAGKGASGYGAISPRESGEQILLILWQRPKAGQCDRSKGRDGQLESRQGGFGEAADHLAVRIVRRWEAGLRDEHGWGAAAALTSSRGSLLAVAALA